MKDYTGQNYQDVIKELEKKHGISSKMIDIEWVTDTSYDSGTIISQTPNEGTKVGSKDKITFEVAAITMPSLIGYTYQEAIAELNSMGVSSSHITIYMADATSSTGYSRVNSVSGSAVVVAQDPYYGGAVEGEVNLYFSSETTAQPSEEPSQSVPESSETSETSESSSSSISTEESSEASTEMQQ